MAPGFEQAAFDTPSGEIGGPIQTEYGWHLIEVIERREGPRDADVVEQERRDRLQAWLDSQLDSLDASGKPIVEINPDWANYIPETPVIAPK
jgi:parvulin-like peptidyl-prolyl isomerase